MKLSEPSGRSRGAALRLSAACSALFWFSACAIFQSGEPTPEQILAAIKTRPAPALSPTEALSHFRLAPGFRIELVAAEPLIEAPVAIDWDDAGRIFAVEMRGYMNDAAGKGEDEASGRVVVLEDSDGDGRMDRSHIYLDGLVLPRAIAVLPEGVLVGEPPNLWLCRDATPLDAIPHCDERERVGDYGVDGMNPEHSENALLRGVSGRIYNARSYRSFVFERKAPGVTTLVTEPAVFRGQWGLDQDEDGTFFYNNNSAVLLVDEFDTRALLRHPMTSPSQPRTGVSKQLLPKATIHSIRANPGLNRAYAQGELRPDGRLRVPTAVSGLALYGGDQFGSDFESPLDSGKPRHVFVPEPGANVVLHIEVEKETGGTSLSATERRYADDRWIEREFVASLDERFRPVDAQVGPDGALYLVDMYRGIIQHSTYVSEYLAKYIADNRLAEPVAMGRIWRVVRDEASGGKPLRRTLRFDASLASTAGRLAALSHPNAWQRSRAQQWLVHDWTRTSGEGLRGAANLAASPSARLRAIWALAQRNQLDISTWLVALQDPQPSVRIAALRAGAVHLHERPRQAEFNALAAALDDPDSGVVLQAVLSADASNSTEAEMLRSFAFSHWDDPLLRQAYLSSIAGHEAASLDALYGDFGATGERSASDAIVADLTQAAFSRFAAENPEDIGELLTSVADYREKNADFAAAMLAGLSAAAAVPGFEAAVLPAPHTLIDNAALQEGQPLAQQLARARKAVTWPGDDFVPGLPVLTPNEAARVERGKALFEESCAVCHSGSGTGIPGVAPSLAGTAFVNDADDWFVRIALQGLSGPVNVQGQHFDAQMPGHGRDPRFDDAALSNLLSYVRRSWGNGGRWIGEEVVARVRAETAGRVAPWTVDELADLDVENALDRFAGRYALTVFPITFKIARSGIGLEIAAFGMGTSDLVRVDRTRFRADSASRALGIEFVEDPDGVVSSILVEISPGQYVSALRVE